MDFSAAIIISLFLLFFIIPFWLLIRASKVKEKKITNRLLDFTQQHQMQLEAQEIWNEKAIGIDSLNKKVIFISVKPNSENEVIIDLNQISSCKLFKQGETKQGLPDIGAKVELQFTPKQNEISVPVITFFDINTDDPLQMNPSLEKAKIWLHKIEACIK